MRDYRTFRNKEIIRIGIVRKSNKNKSRRGNMRWRNSIKKNSNSKS